MASSPQRTAVALKSQASAGVGDLERPGAPEPSRGPPGPRDCPLWVRQVRACGSEATPCASPSSSPSATGAGQRPSGQGHRRGDHMPGLDLQPRAPATRSVIGQVWPPDAAGPTCARSAARGAASSVNRSPQEETGTTVAADSTTQQRTLMVSRPLRQPGWKCRERPLIYQPHDQELLETGQ